MVMRSWASLASMAVAVILAQEKNSTDDSKKFQGTWSVISFEPSGKKLTDEDLKKLKVVIKGDTFTFDHGTKNGTLETTFTLDPSKNPKHIDIKLGQAKDDRLLGIYALDGDNLKLCYVEQGERPTKFATDLTRKSPFLLVLKRQK
jgi:uncharacterized protein (TIGR03067 family)